jgi:hypothetical protein
MAGGAVEPAPLGLLYVLDVLDVGVGGRSVVGICYPHLQAVGQLLGERTRARRTQLAYINKR